MADNKTLEFGIREIKELEFFVDESKEIDGTFDFNYNVDILPDIKAGIIKIIITANFLTTSSKQLFLKGKVATTFSVKNLQDYARQTEGGKDVLDIQEIVWVTFFSIAFSHARAILAKQSAGTKFSVLLMPVINPQQEFKKLFGRLLPSEPV